MPWDEWCHTNAKYFYIIKHLITKCASQRRKSMRNSAVERALGFLLLSVLNEYPGELFEMSVVSSREIRVLPEGFCSETCEASVPVAFDSLYLSLFLS